MGGSRHIPRASSLSVPVSCIPSDPGRAFKHLDPEDGAAFCAVLCVAVLWNQEG